MHKTGNTGENALQALKPYAGVRALERALDLITVLARKGRAKPSELACETAIDRTTVYRLLETLRRKGFVSSSDSDGTFVLTAAVRALGNQLSELDEVRQLVAEDLGRLTRKIRWPSDFATFKQGEMVIRESTHSASPFSVHRAMVGQARPVIKSALGRAVLAAVDECDRRTMLEMAASADAAYAALELDGMVADYRRRGYAWSINEIEPNISAIALPVKCGSRVFGAINVIFFSKVMKPETAAERHLEDLRATVEIVQSRLIAEGLTTNARDLGRSDDLTI